MGVFQACKSAIWVIVGGRVASMVKVSVTGRSLRELLQYVRTAAKVAGSVTLERGKGNTGDVNGPSC